MDDAATAWQVYGINLIFCNESPRKRLQSRLRQCNVDPRMGAQIIDNDVYHLF
jgi:hypothetical protein